MLEKVFAKAEYMDFKLFQNSIENISSDMFLFILIFLYEQRPFSKKTLQTHERSKSPHLASKTFSKSPILNPKNKLIASPNLMSKFSPTIAISRSPTFIKKSLENNNQNDYLRRLTGRAEDSKNVLMKYSNNKKEENVDEGVIVGQIPVNRKDRHNLSNINSNDSKYNSNTMNKNDYSDIYINPAIKYKTEGMGIKPNEDINKIDKK